MSRAAQPACPGFIGQYGDCTTCPTFHCMETATQGFCIGVGWPGCEEGQWSCGSNMHTSLTACPEGCRITEACDGGAD